MFRAMAPRTATTRLETQYGVLSTSDHSLKEAYPATTGWDFATGLGSVNVTNLVNNWP